MTIDQPQAPRSADDMLAELVGEVGHMAETLRSVVQRLDKGAERMDAMQAELSANTEMTRTVRDAGTFVRVGTAVLKWVGIIAIAVGSIVVGVKMATGAGAGPDVGIGPK